MRSPPSDGFPSNFIIDVLIRLSLAKHTIAARGTKKARIAKPTPLGIVLAIRASNPLPNNFACFAWQLAPISIGVVAVGKRSPAAPVP